MSRAIPYLTVDDIIERAIALIRLHPYIQQPLAFDKNGKAIYINHFRNFDGVNINTQGVTLSLFPYSYQGTSNETVDSTNAAITYEPYDMNGRKLKDLATLSLVVNLTTAGFAQESETIPVNWGPGQVVYERSEKERTLYKWMTLLESILLTKPIENLGGLVQNSNVNWISYRTTKWENKENAFIHKASVLWQITFFSPRDAKYFPTPGGDVYVPGPGGSLPPVHSDYSWVYVGVRRIDGVPVYWDKKALSLVDVNGFLIKTTPKGQKVIWDVAGNQFTTLQGVPLTSAELIDPNRVPPGPWIDLNLVLVGTMKPSNRKLYWNKAISQLQLSDDTVVTQLEDGRPIDYDPARHFVTFADTGTPGQPATQVPIDHPIPSFVPVQSGAVRIHDALSLDVRDSFQF